MNLEGFLAILKFAYIRSVQHNNPIKDLSPGEYSELEKFNRSAKIMAIFLHPSS